MRDTLLEQHNMSRKELSRITGIDLAHISRIFSGQRNPSLELADKIARHLGITIDELYQHLADVKNTS